ncbi:shikimate dehydrogenase [Oceanospirillum sp.]|uniref:shikimate dehydrogenase n=1 Tax=Oceanospirillum sp. TaxID=2021254 RepID=UPI003A8E9C15
MTDRYAVFGNPIAHSKSPQIHQAFARQTQQLLSYEALLAPVDAFAQSLRAFLADQGRGCNITVPFKQDAFETAEQLTARAQRAGAVNTLWLAEDGQLWGDTTDGVGLVRDLTDNQQVGISGQRVLILGAGGAVRGVIEPILEQKPASVMIANRTVSKAELLVDIFKDLLPEGCTLSVCGFTDLEGQQFDQVINGTAASLSGDLPPLPDNLLADNAACYDMMYGAETTVFNQWALNHGAAKAIDGLGMLVEQAAESFRIWRGVKPETTEVLADLREQLQG